MNIEAYITKQSNYFRQSLQNFLSSQSFPSVILTKAIHYSVMNGGKYFRPLLVYATGESLGVQKSMLDPIAIAIELIHAYSLIHDDLPAMDNATLRRGKETTHLVFSEAEAILAGDALQMMAIDSLIHADCIADNIKISLIKQLSFASGGHGMVSGQSLDIEAEGKTISLAELETIHSLKTGALINASIAMPTILSNNSAINKINQFAKLLGKTYQIQDDILDIEASTETLGKESGIDIKLNKSTYPNLIGLNEAKYLLENNKKELFDLLQTISFQSTHLLELTNFILARKF